MTPLEEHAAQGFARLGQVLSPEEIAGLRLRTEDLMLGRVVHEGLFFQHDPPSGRYEDLDYKRGWIGPSLAYRKLEKLEKDPVFDAAIRHPGFAALARAHHGGPVTLYRATLWNKVSEGGTELPWHQDGGVFWGVDQPPTLTIWTALDDVPVESGCVELVPGSHKAGFATPAGGTIPAALVDEARAVPLPAVAGESILLHNHVHHRSRLNRTGGPRRALSVCYMSASTRCLRKKNPRAFPVVFP
jgi:phytanoyl-CoA hydroxylase